MMMSRCEDKAIIKNYFKTFKTDTAHSNRQKKTRDEASIL
jgi:hypothetical protein